MAIAIAWLASVFLGNALIVRFGPVERSSWTDAMAQTTFAFFGWGWFVTVAIVGVLSAAGCLLLQWSRPTSTWLLWELPLIASILTVSLDAATRFMTHTQWVDAAGAAEAAQRGNAASLDSLFIVVVLTSAVGLTLRRRDR